MQRRVLVYCASSRSCAEHYRDAARRLGELLARADCTVVYGGGGEGSMGALADGALAAGGSVVGIQPRFMRELEWTHAHISELHVVEDMQERKRMMMDTSDAVVTLPGGSGTLEEFFETLTAKRLGLFLGPIVVVNQNGFFDPCLELLERGIEERFMDPRHRDMWRVVDEVEAVCDAIEASPKWAAEAREFAAV